MVLWLTVNFFTLISGEIVRSGSEVIWLSALRSWLGKGDEGREDVWLVVVQAEVAVRRPWEVSTPEFISEACVKRVCTSGEVCVAEMLGSHNGLLSSSECSCPARTLGLSRLV
jgi:hypothetical protein